MSGRRFHTESRTSENFTPKGLKNLTGEPSSKWGRYVLKESLDNSLEAGENPAIVVEIDTVDGNWEGSYVERLTVRDDGPGIPKEQIKKIFKDVDRFGGNKRHHQLPTRGNQGNALMTLLGIQNLCGGPLVLETQGSTWRIDVDRDTYEDKPQVSIQSEPGSHEGFSLTVTFGGKADDFTRANRVIGTAHEFAALNPQADINIVVDGKTVSVPSSDQSTVETLSLSKKATGGKATWYSFNEFADRLQADVRVEPTLSLREFITEFMSLSSQGKVTEIMAEVGNVDTIRDLFDQNGHMRAGTVKTLHESMKEQTRTYSPSGLDKTLGSVGRDLADELSTYARNRTDSNPSRLLNELQDADEDFSDTSDLSVYYSDGDVTEANGKTVPFSFELAFMPIGASERGSCSILFGINQSVSYSEPSFDPYLQFNVSSGKKKTCARISRAFERIGHEWVVVCNLTCPNIDFNDKGKQQFDTEPFTDVISETVGKAAKKVERDFRPPLNRLMESDSPEPQKSELDNKAPKGYIRKFVFENFMNAYEWATDEGELSSLKMRQFFYVMRDRFNAECDRKGYKWKAGSEPGDKKPLELDDSYFNKLVNDYEAEELGERIIDRDDRGFFSEPHSNRQVPLGTQEVKQYEPDLDQFGTLLFIEKTGFHEQLHYDFEIDKKYDVGLIHTKGLGTNSYRKLVEKIRALDEDIPLYTLTDLDIAGMGIAANADESDTLSAVKQFGAERIGVKVEDIEEYGLSVESVSYKDKQITRAENQLSDGLITQKEHDFLTKGGGQRVEINAFAPVELRDYLETRLKELGVEKVRPEPEDVDVPRTDDSDELEELATQEAVGEFVLSEAEDELVDQIEDEDSITDDTGDIEKELEELPVGSDAQELIYGEICEALDELPPKGWRDVNQDILKDHEEEIEKITNEYREERRNQVLELLEEHCEIEITWKDS